MINKITKVLVANRGEIALRIIRACKELEIKSVAIFSEVDIDGVWVRKADECYPILGNPIEAYLTYEKIIDLAKKADCDAIHPGYGFLSENADFAKACEDNGIIFIGPKAEHIALFGDKMASKVAMKKIGVPVLEGTDTPILDIKEGERISKEIGYPIIIKAAFGGGGRGMRIVKEEKDFKEMFESATSEAKKFFGRGEAFIEKYVENPRHIEVQIIADKYGNVLHLGERDCSIQRRHQKVIEIAPSPRLNEKVRRELYRVSTKAMFKLGYESVGTIEFLVDDNDNIYFIEMNTRVQVEHPVTELISGIDIIQRMIEIAEGDKLQFLQEEIKFRGYAIEFRINAEDMMGAQCSLNQKEKIMEYIKIGKEEGAELLIGGDVLESETNPNGFYIQPTLFKGHNKMRIFQEEIFGPVLAVTTFKDEAEALAIANDTIYGLGSGVWSRDAHQLHRMSRGIEAGRVWVNCYHLYPSHASFGGYKKSGIGRETHMMMLNSYRHTKNILTSYSQNALGFF